jgi:hypothetical protein
MSQPVNATPQAVPLTLYRGDDFFLDLEVTDPGGAAADLTGATAEAQIRASAADVAVLASFDATVTGNVVSLHLPSVEAANLTTKTAAWDCQLTDSDGIVSTLAAGPVTITADVTRP